jgi:polyisoprenyl-phosphate glycosyltransferase
MNFSFLSVVTILDSKEDVDIAESFLHKLYPVLKNNFSDFEIILVNNTLDYHIHTRIEGFEENFKNHIYLLNLSRPIDLNNALVAGLDQANGDYIVFLETEFYHIPEIILPLYQKTQENFDIVYLRSKNKVTGFFRHILLRLFYVILKKYSSLAIDEQAHDSRMISRRSINSILKLRENLRYMKAIYSLVGYRTSWIETDIHQRSKKLKLSQEFSIYINAITSFTDFLQVLLRWIFMVSMLLFIGVTFNALTVKLLGVDLLGHAQKEVTGWAFLVILISLTFSILCLILYILSIYLSKIYSEIKQRPLYIIESVKRF